MKHAALTVAVLTAAILFSAGCAAHRKPVDPDEQPPVTADVSDSPYYHYLEALVLQKRGQPEAAIEQLRSAMAKDPDSVYLGKELARFHIEDRDMQKALAALNSVLRRAPSDIEALILYGGVQQQLENHSAAKKAYTKVLELDDQQQRIYLLLGGLYLQDRETDKARKVFERLVGVFPQSYTGQFFLGKIYAEQGQTEAARQALQRAIELEPELLEPRFEIIRLYEYPMIPAGRVSVRKGDTLSSIARRHYGEYGPAIETSILEANPFIEDADQLRVGSELRMPARQQEVPRVADSNHARRVAALYEEILQRYPGNVRATLSLGYHYHRVGLKQKAAELFEQMGRRSLDEFDVVATVVKYFVDEERYQAAQVILEGMLAAVPKHSDLHHVAGTVYSETDEHAKALEHFKQVKPDSRFFQDAVVHIAFLFQQDGRSREAIEYLQGVLQKQPPSADLLYVLGNLFEETEAFEQAEAALKEGLALEPENIKINFRLGVVYDKQGRKEDCVEQMRAVIRLDPEHASALNYLGYTYADLGRNLDEAETLIKKALRHKPDDGYITDSLGWVYYQKGLYRKAVEILERAVELVPDDPIILEHLGDAYLKIGNIPKALDFYRRSLSNKTKDRDQLEEKIRQLSPPGKLQP